MNKYILRPIESGCDHPDWDCSIYQGEVEVLANDDFDARMLCIEATGIATLVRPNMRISTFPWISENLVECELIGRDCGLERQVIGPEEVRDEWLVKKSDVPDRDG